ncbi:uncharacterized protein C8Q71DRAFT_156326 [Rhodofomes roseus]|uniref:Uncharacterized protein n=1 Tax=Rhodofomes roseus TaxID=34475 RepID=A0ABQ8K9J0_9APHY|nr:uncharacterized protein C8Q71DRAFT_156326 [Rhodofomes roseus]KAH9834015.1 hypothetical protein C8Q71DRAFT_156326 [Rhodofomes roseus]
MAAPAALGVRRRRLRQRRSAYGHGAQIHVSTASYMLSASNLPTNAALVRRLAARTPHRQPWSPYASQPARNCTRSYSQTPGRQGLARGAEQAEGAGGGDEKFDASRGPHSRENGPRLRPGGLPTSGSPVVDAAATALIGLGAGTCIFSPGSRDAHGNPNHGERQDPYLLVWRPDPATGEYGIFVRTYVSRYVDQASNRIVRCCPDVLADRCPDCRIRPRGVSLTWRAAEKLGRMEHRDPALVMVHSCSDTDRVGGVQHQLCRTPVASWCPLTH